MGTWRRFGNVSGEDNVDFVGVLGVAFADCRDGDISTAF